MHRFFVNIKDISDGKVIFTDSRVHQIRNVLRMKTGEKVIVLDNTGLEYLVTLTSITKKEVIGAITQKKQCQGEPRTKITLYQSLLAREKFEFVLQKCTETGVVSFVPVITERSIVKNPGKITTEKLSRYENIISEAAEQSHRGIIPALRSPVNFVQAVSELGNYDVSLVGSTGECLSLKKILQEYKTIFEKLALFIGPEGGFSEKELEVLVSRGAKPFNLGKRVLRTETAAICIPAIILYELG